MVPQKIPWPLPVLVQCLARPISYVLPVEPAAYHEGGDGLARGGGRGRWEAGGRARGAVCGARIAAGGRAAAGGGAGGRARLGVQRPLNGNACVSTHAFNRQRESFLRLAQARFIVAMTCVTRTLTRMERDSRGGGCQLDAVGSDSHSKRRWKINLTDLKGDL